MALGKKSIWDYLGGTVDEHLLADAGDTGSTSVQEDSNMPQSN